METEEKITSPSYNQQPTPVEEEEKGISLADLWHMIVKHWKGIVVAFAVCVIAGLVYGFAIKQPEWSSSGTVVVLADAGTSTDEEETSTGIDSTNLSLSISLVPNVRDFMNSYTVRKEVANQINSKHSTEYKPDDISNLVAASAKTYTSLEKTVYIDVTATTSDAELSQDLVNTMIDVAIEMANSETTGYSKIYADSIYLDSEASEAEDTSMSKKLILAIAAVAGIVIGALYGIIFELCSNKAGSAKDLEDLTGVKVIGTIPDISAEKKHKAKKDKQLKKEGR